MGAGAQALLPGSMQGRKPAEPFRQLWIAAAMQSLDDVEIVRIGAPLEPTNMSLRIPAGGAAWCWLVPAGDVLALGINGTPLMQMMVFGANGQVEDERGPLRVVRILAEAGSPLRVLITNEGFVRSVHPVLSARPARSVALHRRFHIFLGLLFLFGGALVVQFAPLPRPMVSLIRDPLR